MTTAITIAPLATAGVDDAVRLLAAAFEGDPLHRAAYGADVRMRSERFYRTRLVSGSGRWLAACRGEQLLGVLHWGCGDTPAGGAGMSAQVSAQLGWVDRLAATVFGWAAAGRNARIGTAATGDDEPVTLGPLAVLPAMQRQGIGGRLVRQFCHVLDTHRDAGYLETAQPAHVAFYERFGFAVVDEIVLQGIVCIAMYRRAR